MKHARLSILLLGGIAILAGCAKTQTSRTKPLPPRPLGQTVSQRISNLRENVQSLRDTVWRMPADTPARNQSLAAESLGDIAGALAAIEGPQPPGGFRQQLGIIQTSRAQLENSGAAVPPEPTVDTALRAGYNALSSLRDSRFAGDRRIAQLINQIDRQLPQLDATRGAMHWVAVSDILHPMSRALTAMADVVERRPAAKNHPPAGS